MAFTDWSTTAANNATLPGINFAEGQAPSTLNNSIREMMAQARAMYETGSWTPASSVGSLSVQGATYTKIGRLVIATLDVIMPASVSGTAQTITGLPFTAAAFNHHVAALSDYTGSIVQGQIAASTSVITLFDASAAAALTAAQLSGKRIYMTAVYHSV